LYIWGDYDKVLRALPLLTVVPALVLVGVDLDLHRYYITATHSRPSRVRQRPSSLILDAVSLALVSLDMLWALAWTILGGRYRQKMELRAWTFCLDLLLLVAVLGLGDTTLAMRSSKTNCSSLLRECSNSALGIMRAAGALLIVTS
jgi:hypothetical protein